MLTTSFTLGKRHGLNKLAGVINEIDDVILSANTSSKDTTPKCNQTPKQELAVGNNFQ